MNHANHIWNINIRPTYQADMHIPSLIICGSRGGQVTIGYLWKHYIRCPTIVLNGGCLTSRTRIPRGVFHVMVTMGQDYFDTNQPSYTRSQFAELSDVYGILVHLQRHSHMPSLGSLREWVNIVQATIARAVPSSIAPQASVAISPLFSDRARLSHVPVVQEAEVVMAPPDSPIRLRHHPHPNSGWTGDVVPAGDLLRVLKRTMCDSDDLDMRIPMLHVTHEMHGKTTAGWVFEFEVEPLTRNDSEKRQIYMGKRLPILRNAVL